MWNRRGATAKAGDSVAGSSKALLVSLYRSALVQFWKISFERLRSCAGADSRDHRKEPGDVTPQPRAGLRRNNMWCPEGPSIDGPSSQLPAPSQWGGPEPHRLRSLAPFYGEFVRASTRIFRIDIRFLQEILRDLMGSLPGPFGAEEPRCTQRRRYDESFGHPMTEARGRSLPARAPPRL